MTYSWTDCQNSDFDDAYLDWSAFLEGRRYRGAAQGAGGALYEPIFVRLAGPESRAALIAEVRKGTTLAMDSHEFAELSARADKVDPLAGLPDEYALYRRVGTAANAFDGLFTLLDRGVPVRLDDHAGCSAAPQPAEATDKPGAPIVAVIDDGIAFLNRRFLRHRPDGTLQSRLHALWIQAQEQRSGKRVVLGRVLSRDEITGLTERSENEVYADLHGELLVGERQITGFSASHGTHLLDLAGGADADSDDTALDWPLLAVQLPPRAIEDTSGMRFESYLVQGLRWTLRRAREVDPTAPVIVNLSLGVLAGPKDGTRFVEYQVAREAAEWERVTGQPVRIVWSFGNNHEDRLVSRCALAEGETKSVCWRVQPCDQTPSYMEIRLPGTAMAGVSVNLQPPGETAHCFITPAPGQHRTLEQNGNAVARVYHVPARDFGHGAVSPAHLVLALAPTESRDGGEPEAASGAWSVALRSDGGALDVILQIQRDDGLSAYAGRARQSYFDDPACHAWDAARMDWRGLGDKGPITHDGSHSAMASAGTRQVFTVGAALGEARRDSVTPARYSGAGADWSVTGPTVSTVAEDSLGHPGLRACGTMSGSVRMLGGTSAAAARITRALALSAPKIRPNAAPGHLDDFDPGVLTLLPVAALDKPRLGEAIIVLPGDPGRLHREEDRPQALAV